MKIEPIKPIFPISPVRKPEISSETGTCQPVDSSELSSESLILSKAHQGTPKEDEARRRNLEDLKKKIEEGLYEVNENMIEVITESLIGKRYTA